MSQPPPPQYSPDGKFWWNGQVWVPVAPAAVPVPRQSNALRNIGIGCGAIVGIGLLISVIGSLANGGRTSTSVTSTPTPASTSQAAPTSRPTTAPVAATAPPRDGSCSPQPCANDNYGWIVTVSQVIYGADSGNPYENPEAGNVYVSLTLTFTNKTSNAHSASPVNFKLIDGNGVSHTYTFTENCPSWSSVDIAPGGSYGPKCTVFEATAGKPAPIVLDWNPSLFGGDYKMKLS
jgi:hypothetical protein